MEIPMEKLMYPTGRFSAADSYDESKLSTWIRSIKTVPLLFDRCIENLDEAQLQVPYRPQGWNVAQVIHHVADSHMNAYIRLKLALTEDKPTISPYNEKLWAELPDVTMVPLNMSVTLIHALHARWSTLLENLTEADWKRSYYHPESKEYVQVWQMTQHYSWHGPHHAQQIISLRRRMGW
jgi:hypothetical protein